MENIKSEYPFRVWLATLLISPMLIDVFLIASSHRGEFMLDGALPLLFWGILMGTIVSIPAFTIYYIGFYLLSKQIDSIPLLKISLSGIAIIGLVLTILFIFGKDSFDFSESLSGYTMSGFYSAVIIISSFLIKIK